MKTTSQIMETRSKVSGESNRGLRPFGSPDTKISQILHARHRASNKFLNVS